jgi:hypothetical protein
MARLRGLTENLDVEAQDRTPLERVACFIAAAE